MMRLTANGAFKNRGSHELAECQLDFPLRGDPDRRFVTAQLRDDGVVEFVTMGRGGLNGDSTYDFCFEFTKADIARLFSVAFGAASLAEVVSALNTALSVPYRCEKWVTKSTEALTREFGRTKV